MSSIWCSLLSTPGPKSQRRGGGCHQRLARLAVGNIAAAPRRSNTMEGYLEDWGRGKVSAATLWKNVDRMARDNHTDGAVKALHNCGCSVTDQNVHSRIMRLLLEKVGFEQFLTAVEPDSTNVTHILKPSELMRALHTYNPSRFVRAFGADPDRCQRFWEQYLSTPEGIEAASQCPYLAGRDSRNLRYTLPCLLHEDAGPYSKRKGMNVVNWTPLLGEGTDLEMHFVCFTHVLEKALGPDDKQAKNAWGALFRDMDACVRGVDNDGRPFATGVDSDGSAFEWCLVFPHWESRQRARCNMGSEQLRQ